MATAHASASEPGENRAIAEINRKLPAFLAHFQGSYAVQKVGKFGGAKVYYNVLTGTLAWNALPNGTVIKEAEVADAIARTLTRLRRRSEFELLSPIAATFRAVPVSPETDALKDHAVGVDNPTSPRITETVFMNGKRIIQVKQRFWAKRRGVTVDAKGYVRNLEANLFEPLAPEVADCFARADGGELKASRDKLPKMHCLHSSSALAVNVFHYWRNRDKAPLAKALRIPSPGIEGLHFERITSIDKTRFTRHPNIDVVFKYRGGALKEVGIESKLSEALGSHTGIAEKYLKLPELWADIPATRALAEAIHSRAKTEGLNTPQLLKHMLGLKARNGKSGFRLVYLWNGCDCAEAGEHTRQLQDLHRAFAADGMRFHYMSYQELICNLGTSLGEEHKEYVDYLAERYL